MLFSKNISTHSHQTLRGILWVFCDVFSFHFPAIPRNFFPKHSASFPPESPLHVEQLQCLVEPTSSFVHLVDDCPVHGDVHGEWKGSPRSESTALHSVRSVRLNGRRMDGYRWCGNELGGSRMRGTRLRGRRLGGNRLRGTRLRGGRL